jgi:pimeloyl-ACP methyl ester carboxylesterase
MARAAEWERELVSGVEVSTTGAGPGVVVIPGDNRRTRHYENLARELAGAHTVHVVERRGRGASAARGPAYGVESEADDVLEVLRETGARAVFGHGYGGLVALHVGLRQALDALIAYEPGVSLDGSFDTSWLGAFTRHLDAGRRVAAMATYLQGTNVSPYRAVPLLRAISLVHGPRGREIHELMRTTPAEIAEIARLDSDGGRYAEIASRTLLLGGTKSPTYRTGVLPRLAAILPNADFQILPDLAHNAPDDTAPDTIAQQIRLHLIRTERHDWELTHPSNLTAH